MKPRFSILTLLGITAYVAVNVSAFLYPMSAWVPIAFWSSVAIMARWAVAAALETSARSVFARGALLFALIYAGVTTRTDGDDGFLKTPHAYLLDSLDRLTGYVLSEGMADFVSTSEGDPRFYYARVRRSNLTSVVRYEFALLFGLIGGSVALWQFRRQERRTT